MDQYGDQHHNRQGDVDMQPGLKQVLEAHLGDQPVLDLPFSRSKCGKALERVLLGSGYVLQIRLEFLKRES